MSWGLPFVSRDDFTLTDDVSVDRGEQVAASQAWLETKIRIEGVDNEVIVVGFAWWRRGTAIDRAAETGYALDRAGDRRRHRRRRIDRDPLRHPLRRGWNLVDHPVHERRRVSRVRILADDRKLFGRVGQ